MQNKWQDFYFLIILGMIASPKTWFLGRDLESGIFFLLVFQKQLKLQHCTV